MKGMKKQQGFTIIELVVVILLLGILTATALPRFMDVEDQAHGAVVDAVRAGLVTSAGLFRAQWYAEGQPETVVNYDNMRAYVVSGYPLGTNAAQTVSVMTNSTDCVEIYSSFLQQGGRPSISTIAVAAGALTSANVRSRASTTDFLAYLDNTSAATRRVCTFVYTGQFNDPSLGDVPVLTYSAVTGNVEEGTSL